MSESVLSKLAGASFAASAVAIFRLGRGSLVLLHGDSVANAIMRVHEPRKFSVQFASTVCTCVPLVET